MKSAYAQIFINNTSTITENFNNIPISSPYTLPNGWKASGPGEGLTASWNNANNSTELNFVETSISNVPLAGKILWATSTDRSIGFYTSNSYSDPNAYMAQFQNNTGEIVNGFTLSYTGERRITSGNNTQYNGNPTDIYFSVDGINWNIIPASNSFSGVNSFFNSQVQSNSATVIDFSTVTINLYGLQIINGGNFYLKWVLKTFQSGIHWSFAIDNVSLTAVTDNNIASIENGGLFENFNTLGVGNTNQMPLGFFAVGGNDNAIVSTSQSSGTSGSGVLTSSSTGGTYNFTDGVNATSTDRSLGFLTSASYPGSSGLAATGLSTGAGPISFVYGFKNNTCDNISSLEINWDYEKYRSGSRAFNYSFFHGATTNNMTAANAGDQSYPADADNNIIFNPPSTINKSVVISNLNIPVGEIYYIKWTLEGVGGYTNGQGLGLDNLKIAANGGSFPVETSTTYLLTTDNSATTTGNTNASTGAFGSGLSNVDANSKSNFGMHANQFATTKQNSITGDDYFEYIISPTAGNDIYISDIALEHQRSSNFSFAVYYSIGNSYQISTNTQLGNDIAAATSWSTIVLSPTRTIKIPNGSKLIIRIYAWTSFPTAFLNIRNFRINGYTIPVQTSLIDVSTQSASSISPTQATLTGEITSINGGNASSVGFVLSNDINFSSGNTITVASSGSFVVGSFSENVTGLTPNTTYYFKAFASNCFGTFYGTIDSFKTFSAGAVIYWDANGNVVGSGNTGGNWSDLKWTSDLNGLTGTSSYLEGFATFSAGTDGTGAFTVNVDNAVNANGISFEEGTVTIGASTGTLNLTAPNITVANGATGIIEEPVISTVGITKAGTGLLKLTADNSSTFTAGNINVNAGILESDGSALAVDLQSRPLNNRSATIAANATLRLHNTDGNLNAYSGDITGAGTLEKSGIGRVSLSGNNNAHTGDVIINGGDLDCRTGNAIGDNSRVIINNGGRMTIVVSGDETIGTVEGDGILDFYGAGTPRLYLTGNANTAFSGTIIGGGQSPDTDPVTGTGVLIKNSTGELTLSGSNSFSGGISLNSGILNLVDASALGTGRFYINGGSFDNTSGATLVIGNNFNQTWGGDFTYVGSNDLSIGNNTSGEVILTDNRTVTVSNNNLIIQGSIIQDSNLGSYSLTKKGAGTLRLRGNNTFTGGTFVLEGMLLATNPVGSATGTGNVVVANGATIGGSRQIGNAQSGTVTINNGGTIAPGVINIGTLKVFGNITIEGKLEVEYSDTTIDLLNVDGNLTLGSNSTIDFLSQGTLTNNIYVIVQYGSLNGTFSNVNNIPSGFLLDYAYQGNKIALINTLTSINTNISSFGPFCNNTSNNISVEFSSSGLFNNNFSVQMSDANGVFPTNATDNIIGSGPTSPINAIIPSNLQLGNGYLIRVVNNSPTVFGNDNGSNIVINPSINVSQIIGNTELCQNNLIDIKYAISGINLITGVSGLPLSVGAGFSSDTLYINGIGDVPGIYNYNIQLDGLCGIENVIGSITVNENPNAQLLTNPATPIVCQGNSIEFTASGGVLYNFYRNNSLEQSSSNNTYTILSPSDKDSVKVIITTNSNCSAESAQINILVIELPEVNLGNDTLICAGNIFTLEATNGMASYLWSTTETTSFINVNTTNIYSVTITDNNGCTNTDDIEVIFDVCNSISILSDNINISIFPNPTDNFINIKSYNYFNKTISFNLKDINGKHIVSDNFLSQDLYRLNLSGITPGTYIIEVISNLGILNAKIIKQ